jgi:hypothetical protein
LDKKVLSIGNSFSQDAQAYFVPIANAGGMEVFSANLYIGGCSLQTHWTNAQGEMSLYELEQNGETTGIKTSIRETLESERWDIVTFQQASGFSGIWESYLPYLTELSGYVSQYAPGAKQVIHETWAYEGDSTHKHFAWYENDQQKMYQALREAYQKAADLLSASIIPSGDCIQALRQTKEFDYAKGGRSLCRDGYHMDYLYGRYAVGAVWYETLLGGDITKNSFVPAYEGIKADVSLIQRISEVVHTVCRN